MVETNNSLHEALQKFFGFNEFKSEQELIIQSVLDKKILLSLCLPAVANRFVINYQR